MVMGAPPVPRLTGAGLTVSDGKSQHLCFAVRSNCKDGPSQVLFRGLRLKVGIDVGSALASINPCTGRMAYR